jgi:hypothetical protein
MVHWPQCKQIWKCSWLSPFLSTCLFRWWEIQSMYVCSYFCKSQIIMISWCGISPSKVGLSNFSW